MLRRPGTVLLIALITTLPMGYWTARLFGDTRADVKELLPSNAQSVLTLNELERRFGGRSYLNITIESPSREANRRFSDALVEGIKKLPNIRSVRNKLGEEKSFFEQHKWLYVDLEDLEEIQERVEDAVNDAKARANPLLVDLEDKKPVELDFSDIEKKYQSKQGLMARFPSGYFESEDGHRVAVLVSRRGTGFGIAGNRQFLGAIERIVRELDPASHDPKMEVGYSGELANLIAEQDALVEDLITASIITLFLLALLVIGYYRRWRAVIILALPVFVGCAWTFGLSHFLVGHLNASSAFLGPIVPGNGINFGLVLLARYIEERRTGTDVERAVRTAARYTVQGTSTAALAASIAYGSLTATDFLGFKHFGIVGGLGMVLCWLATFAIMPALIIWMERRWPSDPGREISLYPPGMLASIPARFIRALPAAFAILGVALGLTGAVFTTKFLQDPFEKNFQKLRSTFAAEKGAEYWQQKIQGLFGRSITPQVLLVDRPEDVEPVIDYLDGLIAKDGDASPIGDVAALQKLVPKQQKEKIAVLGEIRGLLTDDLLDNLSETQRARALELRPPEEIVSVTASDLPESIRSDFRELDGREGLVVLVNPNIKLNQWHVDVIRATGEVLRSIPLPDGRVVHSSGNYVIYTDMLESVAIDGPRATMYSFFGVILLCFFAYRRPGRVAVVVGALLVGVSTLGALCWFLDLRINFLNFIALPITFGIGVDYAVNTYSRYLIERGTNDPVMAAYHAISSTGGAVVLCSLTTIVGYGSLLFARNGGLISFGQVAILGEITTLLAAIVFMPAWLMAWSRKS